MRVHRGDEDQPADPLIAAKQGPSGTPAYRGLAYVVFERLPLEAFGNRLPQLTFEVIRPVHGLCRRIRAINVIPGAGEHVYEPAAVSVSGRFGASFLPNRSQLCDSTDWRASMDALQALCPDLKHVALVVSWFGNDLRAGHCLVRPLTEPGSVDGYPYSWSVAGLTRASAGVVSSPDGKPAFGGTPSDGSVIRAIRDLRQRGLGVTLYPFVMMDIAPGNELPDPWTGAASQPAYPWRGRITCDPAPGRPGTAEGTGAAQQQVATFMGTCLASHFQTAADSVSYSGPAEWSLRRLVLHMAALGKAAGGVDSIILCSELSALTRVRGSGATNPAVAGLKALAAQVRSLCGPGVRITYGADWTEYGAEVRSGGQDVRFPLDPLWADPGIDAVAIDWYPPVTDWRDGLGHLDAGLYDGPHDLRMFADRMASGEAHDWYYASDADRIAQVRTPISDGAYGKPWIYRAKDLVGWWSNPHHPRTGSVESTTPTEWVPQSKPVWLLELGCPAVDRSGNGPHVFPDPKSSASALPPFSRGMRDDLVQARHLTATLEHFDPAAPGFQNSANPLSGRFAGRMLDPDRIYLWAWDARPFPAFPLHDDRWADAENYHTGHWLNGRLEGLPMDDLLAAVLRDYGLTRPETISADGFAEGYVLDRPMSARSAIEPLAQAFSFDAVVSGGNLQFVRRAAKASDGLEAADFAVGDDGDRPMQVRARSSGLATAFTLAFTDADADYRSAAVRAVLPGASEGGEAAAEIALGLRRAEAAHRAEVMLNEAWAARDLVRCAVPPSRMGIEPGDVLRIEGKPYRVRRLTDGKLRFLEGVSVEPSVYLGAPLPMPPGRRPAPVLGGPPAFVVLDLAAADAGSPVLSRLAVAADPWPGGFTLWRSLDGQGFAPVQRIATRATIGETLTPLAPGPLWRLDRGASVDVLLSQGALESVSLIAALNGANLLAIEAGGLGWEILAYTTATLLSAGHWRLSGLLRGQAGSESLAAVPKEIGARIVVLDGSLSELAVGFEWLNRSVLYRLSVEGRDHADPMAASFTATASGAALLPLSPVHLKARRETDGIRLTWLRRTRFGGDSWELAEVPLNEDTEAYAVDILSGSTVKRTLQTTSQDALYRAVDEMADFGALQDSLRVRLCQLSGSVGRGQATDVLLRVA